MTTCETLPINLSWLISHIVVCQIIQIALVLITCRMVFCPNNRVAIQRHLLRYPHVRRSITNYGWTPFDVIWLVPKPSTAKLLLSLSRCHMLLNGHKSCERLSPKMQCFRMSTLTAISRVLRILSIPKFFELQIRQIHFHFGGLGLSLSWHDNFLWTLKIEH